MSSQLRSETSRINGAKSQGPTTPAGLEKSSQNAIKHGITSGSAMVLSCEIKADFDDILNTFIEIHRPANPAEKDLVEEMVAARWRIRRLWTIETSMLNAEIVKQEAKSSTSNPGVHLALAFRALSDDSRSLHLASRYESRLHRIYDHSYATLRELQQIRESLPPSAPPPASEIPPEPPSPADNEILPSETREDDTAITASPVQPENEKVAKRTQDGVKAPETNQIPSTPTPGPEDPAPAWKLSGPIPNAHEPTANL